MRTSVRATPPEASRANLLVVAAPKGGTRPRSLARLDAVLGGVVNRVYRSGDFEGTAGESLLLHPATGPDRVLLVGLGDRDAVRGGSLRAAAAVGARVAIERGAELVDFSLVREGRFGTAWERVGQEVAEGAGQGGWAFESLRDTPVTKGVIRRYSLLADEAHRAEMERGRRRGAAIADGHRLARDLQMLPGNHCPPSRLATEARSLGRRHGMKVTVLRRSDLEKGGFNALLAVAQGSAEEPRLIALEYRGGPATEPPVCLIGKGVTFDSGGISLKPPLSMEEMKFDMSGAAAVLGAMDAIGRLKPRVNVVGVVPTTENLPSGTAVKPGDVVRTHFGKTVEIINTDAEGRLILCDALSYARRFKPACMLDAATLTGAVVIGLGNHAIGLLGNDDGLLDEVRRAGERADERCWPLPLWQPYRDQLKSDIADLKNIGGRPAGTITAAAFLEAFVEPGMPWAHLDIAGTAYTDTARPGMAKGPTGIGVRLFTEFVLGRAR